MFHWWFFLEIWGSFIWYCYENRFFHLPMGDCSYISYLQYSKSFLYQDLHVSIISIEILSLPVALLYFIEFITLSISLFHITFPVSFVLDSGSLLGLTSWNSSLIYSTRLKTSSIHFIVSIVNWMLKSKYLTLSTLIKKKNEESCSSVNVIMHYLFHLASIHR